MQQRVLRTKSECAEALGTLGTSATIQQLGMAQPFRCYICCVLVCVGSRSLAWSHHKTVSLTTLDGSLGSSRPAWANRKQPRDCHEVEQPHGEETTQYNVMHWTMARDVSATPLFIRPYSICTSESSALGLSITLTLISSFTTAVSHVMYRGVHLLLQLLCLGLLVSVAWASRATYSFYRGSGSCDSTAVNASVLTTGSVGLVASNNVSNTFVGCAWETSGSINSVQITCTGPSSYAVIPYTDKSCDNPYVTYNYFVGSSGQCSTDNSGTFSAFITCSSGAASMPALSLATLLVVIFFGALFDLSL